MVVKSTYMNDIDTNTMSNATRCFDTTLLNVYGPNYFAASCFPDSFRVEWVKSCGIALQINETDLWHHLTLLQPERVSQTPQSTVRERALAYLSESVVHSSMWTRVSDALGTTNARNVDYASLKDELTHIRLAGGVDYLALHQLFCNTKGKSLSLKLTAAQNKKLRPLFECDEHLAALVYAYQKTHVINSSSAAFVDNAYESNPETYLPERTGRYFKIWSRLNAKERDERKSEAVLYAIASECVAKGSPPLAQNISLPALYEQKMSIFNDVGDTWWQKRWSAKSGIFTALPEVATIKPSTDNDMDALISLTSKVTLRNAKQQVILQDILYILACVAASRTSRTRQEVLRRCIQEYGEALSTSMENTLLRAIDKVFLV